MARVTATAGGDDARISGAGGVDGDGLASSGAGLLSDEAVGSRHIRLRSGSLASETSLRGALKLPPDD